KMFQRLLEEIDIDIANSILKANLQPQNQSSFNSTVAKPKGEVGRNDPCPCGSGKKFKKCHGK
ncbi:MAG: SEC-C domain-containing protein, partial [Candidatus Staskawiczbacteria bacterium]|nr:SEC-C domain-containing protein [Candidatus Staskawiczbacteria bacterium]